MFKEISPARFIFKKLNEIININNKKSDNQ